MSASSARLPASPDAIGADRRGLARNAPRARRWWQEASQGSRVIQSCERIKRAAAPGTRLVSCATNLEEFLPRRCTMPSPHMQARLRKRGSSSLPSISVSWASGAVRSTARSPRATRRSDGEGLDRGGRKFVNRPGRFSFSPSGGASLWARVADAALNHEPARMESYFSSSQSPTAPASPELALEPAPPSPVTLAPNEPE